MDLLDHNMAPEQSLLRLSHSNSTFFNVGVAILDAGGVAVWSEPERFLAAGTSFATEPWFDTMRRMRTIMIAPGEPERESDALLYVVSPIIRGGQVQGAMLGAIDLATGGPLMDESRPYRKAQTVLATRAGQVVYPAKPPAFSAELSWRGLMQKDFGKPYLGALHLEGRARVVAGAQVAGTDMVLLSLVDDAVLFGDPRGRLISGLATGLAIALLSLGILVLLLRRTLRFFERAQEEAARFERVRLIGEAANLIAHEVRNSLNGMQVGLDLVLRQSGGGSLAVTQALRSEFERLSSLTTGLLTFARGVVPRPVSLDLSAFAREVVATFHHHAGQDVAIQIEAAGGCLVHADPSLINVVLRNLLGNAVEAVSARHLGGEPRVSVSITAAGAGVRLAVSDNGPGVPPGIRSRLFEPFVSGKRSGVGIGLAMSRKIAEAHGGSLVLEPDTPGRGAMFVMTLPAEGTCTAAS